MEAIPLPGVPPLPAWSRPVPVLPGAEPFASDPASITEDGGIGVVLCHGITGSPQSVRPWGEYLAREGFTVRAPRLPGHGTRWQDLARTRWPDWYATLAASIDELRARCRTVVVCGFSMGGTLTLRAAQRYGDAIDGIVLVNPSVTTLHPAAPLLRLAAPVVPWWPGVGGDIAKPGVAEVAYDRLPLRAAASLADLWDIVRPALGEVTVPMLLMHSAADHVVEPVNARIVLDGVASTDVREVVLHESYHVATLDHDAPTIFAGSAAFARRLDAARHAVRQTTGSGSSAGNTA